MFERHRQALVAPGCFAPQLLLFLAFPAALFSLFPSLAELFFGRRRARPAHPRVFFAFLLAFFFGPGRARTAPRQVLFAQLLAFLAALLTFFASLFAFPALPFVLFAFLLAFLAQPLVAFAVLLAFLFASSGLRRSPFGFPRASAADLAGRPASGAGAACAGFKSTATTYRW